MHGKLDVYKRQVEQSLNTLISKSSHIKMDTYHAQLQNAEVAARMMKLKLKKLRFLFDFALAFHYL